ncbi:hypothetical protein HK098_000408 [Nowakowskiella sp. JEL0407]|nr:hypothetical protein HK098_000408 [Nowakowskiella sp. JEL0407]
MPMFKFHTREDVENWIVGSDADIGGLSEAYWGHTLQNHAKFWGKISTDIPPNSKLTRSGYAGIRSKELPLTLFHRPRFDTEPFRYLAIRARGDNRQWFVNIQTDSLYPTYLWQHRMYFSTPGEWETILIPFRDFVLTAKGYIQTRNMPMYREKVKTVGFSVIRQPGNFSLELDWIKAVNTPKTMGDFDVMEPGTYLDKFNRLRRLKPGQTIEQALGNTIRFFEDPNDKDLEEPETFVNEKDAKIAQIRKSRKQLDEKK